MLTRLNGLSCTGTGMAYKVVFPKRPGMIDVASLSASSLPRCARAMSGRQRQHTHVGLCIHAALPVGCRGCAINAGTQEVV